MANYEAFFNGSQYPFEKSTVSSAYLPSTKDIAYPSDPLTANQLKKVSDKISTGAQTIEVSGLGLTGAGPMKHLASVPKQHWKEIDRLRQLTGVDLTFHGPLVDPTGVTGRGNWSEDQRVEAERQMKAAVELAQQMNSQTAEKNSKGVVMTFHANNGLPEVKRQIKRPDGTIETVQMAVIDERTGQIGNIPTPRKDYFKGGEEQTAQQRLDELNEEQWRRQIENVFLNSTRANNELIGIRGEDENIKKELDKSGIEYGNAFEAYKSYKDNYGDYKKTVEEIGKNFPQTANIINKNMINIQNASFFAQESYTQMKEFFNEAYHDVEKGAEKNEPGKKEALTKLKNYAKDLKGTFDKYNDNYNVAELQQKIAEGTRLLNEDSIRPKKFKELEKFAVDKGSETFSNVALFAYQNAKAHNRSPGIISIENPPAGMSGLTRAEEIKELVLASREKFVNKAVENKMMSREKATEVSKQIIGATWDVGHINSIRKWGYGKEDVLKQAETIAPFVKHMHIADNLGFEDSELPAGMGNVPIDEILNSQWEGSENFRNAKKVIETGDWFSRQGGMGMTKTPVTEAFSGLQAPVYFSGKSSMGDAGAAYWNSAVNSDASSYSGLGIINPEVHHSIYGGGFGGLPAYSGGELPGKASNSSFSGAPLD
ncbi:sugar phosphate isomerase/epimerase [Candidatus Pacearchaeota archaeon]|nr:sugar phosphate isomerase/epimerase [Candidatus Pacearchaeota archaeon]